MKKTNLYYAAMFGRKEMAKETLIIIFLLFMSWPRLLVEVFIRKNFGERYFSMPTAVLLTIFLFLLIFGIDAGLAFTSNGPRTYGGMFMHDITWFLYLGAFLFFCIKRQKEIEREPGVFDFAKFSLYNGDIDQRFYDLRIKGQEPTRRVISTQLEPLFLLIIGVVLIVLQQKIGFLITFCSICYATGYIFQYRRGDHFIMDTIDQMISNEEMVASFVDGRRPEDTRGFETMGRKPMDPDMRRRVADSITPDEEIADAY